MLPDEKWTVYNIYNNFLYFNLLKKSFIFHVLRFQYDYSTVWSYFFFLFFRTGILSLFFKQPQILLKNTSATETRPQNTKFASSSKLFLHDTTSVSC